MPVKLSPFVHRNNSDGTIDSICTECIMVIATSRLEAALQEDEEGHKCDPFRLEYLCQLLPTLRR
jgi:hypothetical protein